MRDALAQSGSLRFRDFWEIKSLCLPLFKETLPPQSRAELWSLYTELSQEARQLKETLREEANFAGEQIELAVQALEKDLAQYDLLVSQMPTLELPEMCASLADNRVTYQTLQRELDLLNVCASRSSSLRRELLKTEMRVKTKNQLLDRLSACADRIFPRRNELIQNLSAVFSSDVQRFADQYISGQLSRGPSLYALREEIKELQQVAKALTLSTPCFTETRIKLSECWDAVKDQERERKKEFAQYREGAKEHIELVRSKIQGFAEAVQQGMSEEELEQRSHEVMESMQPLPLSHMDVRMLREELALARKPLDDQYRAQQEERIERQQEKERMKRAVLHKVQDELTVLLQKADQLEVEQMAQVRDQLLKEVEPLALSKAERQVVERLFKEVRDLIDDKRADVVISLSDDERDQLQQLRSMGEERRAKRQEIKGQLEQYRKALGSSGFDFEKAMLFREMIEAEKASLDKVNASIQEIEAKIAQLEEGS